MIPKGLFTHIAMIGLSLGIFFTYLQPSFNELKLDQDAIVRYQEERAKVQEVNVKLNELMLKAQEITNSERDALDVYVPVEVDSVEVQRDLLLIAERAGVELSALDGGGRAELGEGSGGIAERSRLVPYEFSVGFTASYEDIKSFLALVERNNYPLTLSKLTIAGAGADGVEATNELTTEIALTAHALEFNDTPVAESFE